MRTETAVNFTGGHFNQAVLQCSYSDVRMFPRAEYLPQWRFYGGGGGGGGLEPPQTCSAPPPGTMLGRYKISLMSSHLELGHVRAM